MLKHSKSYLFIILLIIAASCSTTKVIPEGESRLKENKITILNSKSYSSSSLLPYIKQKPNTYFIFGWNPFLNIYNWSNGKDNSWDRFVKKIGQEPVVFDEDLVASSIKNMNNHLIYQGYYNSHITDKITTKNKKTVVDYRVLLGKQYIIDSVEYVFPDSSITNSFYSKNLNQIILKDKILSEEYLNNSSEEIAQGLRNDGYFGFTKNYLFFVADTLNNDSNASLKVEIKDYTRNESESEAKKHVKFIFGDVNITPSRKRNNPLVYEFVADSVVARTSRVANTPYDTLNYNDLNLIYRRKLLLRPKMLWRMNRVQAGQLYNEKDVAGTYTRLSNLKLFSSVNVQMDQVDSNVVDCNINLTASELQGYKVGLEASSNSTGLFGISPSLSYYHKNLFRGAELFSINFMGNFQFAFNSNKRSTEFGVSSSLSIPNFLFLPDRIFKSNNVPRTEFAISYNYQKRPEYTRNIISGSFGYTWSARDRFFYKVLPLQLSIVKLYNMKPDFYEKLKDPFLKNSYQDHFDMGLGANFYYTTDPSAQPSHSYFYLRWQHDLSGTLLSLFNRCMPKNAEGYRIAWGSPYSQYYRTEASAVYTWKFGKDNKQAFATRLLGGIGFGYGNSVAMPFEKLFWAGGAYSLRAWQARTVGPGYAQLDTAFTIANQTGGMRLEANIEYRFPLFWNFEGALFMDAGNVWNLKKSVEKSSSDSSFIDRSKDGIFYYNTFYKHIAVDWGIGLRLNLSFAILRLDLGMKIYDPPTFEWMGPNRWLKKGNYGVQFGVGYPF